MIRPLLLAIALFAAHFRRAAQTREEIAAPMLRANVTVTADLVRIGDVVDNAGERRADRDLPRAGSRHHRHAAGRASARGAARPSGDRRRHRRPEGNLGHAARRARCDSREIETAIARALERRNGLGDAANLSLDLRPRPRRSQARRRPLRRAAAGRRPLRAAQQPLRRHLRDRQRCRRRAGQTALHRHRDRDRGGRRAGARRRAQRNPEIRPTWWSSAAPRPRSATMSPSRDRAVGMQARRQLRAGQALRTPISQSPTWCSATRASR